ncbi:MAG: hypothetical protein L3J15_07165 [Devosiaceae bacterium]|nr:hypothetical protein [Devosiaceae bacterium]
MPTIWKRAVRLTKKRYESANPLTMSEFRADKDQLRAQFALKTRKLEMQIEKLRLQLSEQLVELNEAKSELALMDVEQDRQQIISEEFEAKNEKLSKRILELEKSSADISQKLRMREREVESKKDDIRDRTLELEKKTIGLSHKLRMKEKEIEELISKSPKNAEQQIANANSKLNDLVQKTKAATKEEKAVKNSSLIQDITYQEELEGLHKKILKIENSIQTKWQKNSDIKKSDLHSLRKDMEEVAAIVMNVINPSESETVKKPKETEESLLAKVQKFVKNDNNLDQEELDDKKNIKISASSISKRFKIFQNVEKHQ